MTPEQYTAKYGEAPPLEMFDGLSNRWLHELADAVGQDPRFLSDCDLNLFKASQEYFAQHAPESLTAAYCQRMAHLAAKLVWNRRNGAAALNAPPADAVPEF